MYSSVFTNYILQRWAYLKPYSKHHENIASFQNHKIKFPNSNSEKLKIRKFENSQNPKIPKVSKFQNSKISQSSKFHNHKTGRQPAKRTTNDERRTSERTNEPECKCQMPNAKMLKCNRTPKFPNPQNSKIPQIPKIAKFPKFPKFQNFKISKFPNSFTAQRQRSLSLTLSHCHQQLAVWHRSVWHSLLPGMEW